MIQRVILFSSVFLVLFTVKAEELFPEGDFADVIAWNEAKGLQSPFVELVDQNSPFKEIYPDNGHCLRLIPGGKDRWILYLKLPIQEMTSGKVLLSFDCLLEDADAHKPDEGYGFRFSNIGNTNHTYLRVSRKLLLNQHVKSKESRWDAPDELLPSTWYHFQVSIDLDAQTVKVQVFTIDGIAQEYEGKVAAYENPDEQAINGFAIASVNTAPRMLLDNLSVQIKTE